MENTSLFHKDELFIYWLIFVTFFIKYAICVFMTYTYNYRYMYTYEIDSGWKLSFDFVNGPVQKKTKEYVVVR